MCSCSTFSAYCTNTQPLHFHTKNHLHFCILFAYKLYSIYCIFGVISSYGLFPNLFQSPSDISSPDSLSHFHFQSSLCSHRASLKAILRKHPHCHCHAHTKPSLLPVVTVKRLRKINLKPAGPERHTHTPRDSLPQSKAEGLLTLQE